MPGDVLGDRLGPERGVALDVDVGGLVDADEVGAVGDLVRARGEGLIELLAHLGVGRAVDDVVAERRFDDPRGDLAGLEADERALEGRDHHAFGKDAEEAALLGGARVAGVRAGEVREVARIDLRADRLGPAADGVADGS